MNRGLVCLTALWVALFAWAWAAAAEPQAAADPALSEAQRRAIFREVGTALVKAEREAERKYRDAPQSMERVHYEEDLSEAYKREIAAKHGIRYEQLMAIGVEGFKNRWHVD